MMYQPLSVHGTMTLIVPPFTAGDELLARRSWQTYYARGQCFFERGLVYASVNECNECAMDMTLGGASGSGRYFGRTVE